MEKKNHLIHEMAVKVMTELIKLLKRMNWIWHSFIIDNTSGVAKEGASLNDLTFIET